MPIDPSLTEAEETNDPWVVVKAGAGIGFLVACFGLNVYLNRAPEPTALEKRAEQERIAQAEKDETLATEEAPLIARAEAAVLRSLRDPDSAEFGHVFVRYCKALDCREGDPAHGTPMVCGGVNAKNGFGGYTGIQVFIYGNGTLIPPDVAATNPLTARICLD